MAKKLTFLLVAATALLLSLTIPTAAQGQRNHVAKTEAKDDHGIITSPGEGQRKVYARSG